MQAPCAGMQGKMLSSVTEEDNGDVLTVVDGEWQKAETSGGGGNDGNVLYCKLSYDSASEFWTLNQSFSDVNSVINDKLVFFVDFNSTFDQTDTQPLVFVATETNIENSTVKFESINGTSVDLRFWETDDGKLGFSFE